jgi:tetrahydromethanopterin S-methyltransferase subunit B
MFPIGLAATLAGLFTGFAWGFWAGLGAAIVTLAVIGLAAMLREEWFT